MQKLNHIDNGKEFDWGLASKDYAKYRDIYLNIIRLGRAEE